MLDADLSDLYGVRTKALNQAVRRNRERFPEDFMFQITTEEQSYLRSQIVTSSIRRGGNRYRPFVFTEQGVAMLSSVLRSPAVVLVNIEIIRTFVRLRRSQGEHAALARKIDELEEKYDEQFTLVFDAIRALMFPAPDARRPIGFQPK
jgi:hypothetical protein